MAKDDYRPLGFYETNLGTIQEGFAKFSAEGEHYFTYNVGNQIYLISEGYASEGARDNGIESVTKNMGNPDRYKFNEDSGNHFFGLRAGNNQEIATSRWFKSAGEAQTASTRLRGGGIGTPIVTKAFEGDTIVAANRDASISIAAAAPPANPDAPKKKRKKKSTGPKKPKKEKVYLQEGSYPINNITYKIFRSSNDKHYFTFHKEDGKTLCMNSDVRGFVTEAEAKAMVDEVFKYGPVESNYEGKATRNGKYYFYIKGEEGKNIAKSFFYGTTDDMQKSVGLLLAGEGALPAAAAATPAAKAPVATEKAKTNKNVDEYLNCDAYKGHARSADNKDFVTFTNDGEFYFAMVDNNEAVRLRSEGYTSESGRDNGIASVTKNRKLEERWSVTEEDGKFFGILKAGNHQEIGRSCPYNDKASASWNWGGYSAGLAAAAATALAAKTQEEEAAKAAAAAASAKAIADKAAADAAAAKARAEEEEVAKLKAKKKYEEEEAERARLVAEEKAKREAEEAEKEKLRLAAKAKSDQEAKVAATAAAAGAVAVTANAKKSGLDEYLHCDEYKNKAKSSTHKGFSTFSKDGQHYFALLDNNGNVRLRSQGYKNEAGRNNGMDSVIKNRGIESRWSVLDDGGKFFSILKAGNSQEIGRSCPYKDKGAAGWKWAAPVAAVAAMAATPKKEKPKKVTPPPVKKVKEVKKVKAVAAAAPVAAAETSGCMKYLWLLLPLLALLLLWWFWTQGCFGCDKAATVTPVVAPIEQTIIPVDTIDTAAEEARLKAEAELKAEAARVQAAADEKARKMREKSKRLRGGNKNSGY